MSNMLQMLGLQAPDVASDAPNPIDLLSGIPNYGADPAASQQPPGTNVLQGLAPPPAAPVAPPAPTRPARARSSFLDVLGRAADVLATTGGAPALYQPTLDARQNRVLSLGDHDRTVAESGLDQEAKRADITQTHGAIATAQNALTGAAVKHLQAIIAANPNADVASIWPMLANQAGLPSEQASALGQMFASDPSSIAAMAGEDDGKGEKYGGNIVYATDPAGNLHAFQAGLGSNEGRDILPTGWKPADPLKVVNTGASTALVGTHSAPAILPNTPKPDTVLTTNTSRANNAATNAKDIRIAGMPARGKAPTAAAGGSSMASANMLLSNIERGFDDLHGMQALPGDNGGAVGNALAALGRTGIGQHIGEQAGNVAAQRRLLMEKDINSLQSEMIKSLPASATRTKFEQEIQRKRLPDPQRMDYNTGKKAVSDLRALFAQAQRDAAAELAASKPSGGRPTLRAPIVPRGNAGKPTVSNW